MKKSLFTILLILLCVNFAFSNEVYGDAQILKSGHWIYDSMYRLAMESKNAFHINTTPLSIAELKFYLAEVDQSSLSGYGKDLYQKISDFLYSSPKNDDINGYGDIVLAPEYYIRTNENIVTDNNYYYKDNFLTIPLGVGFGDNFAIQADAFYGTSYFAQLSPNCKTNFPKDFDFRNIEFEFPRFSYFNFNKNMGKWGIDFQLAKQGLTIGKTQMGSVIYNNTFETEIYSQTSLYAKSFKYTLGLAEVDFDRFLYLHQFYFRPFNCLNVTIVEGGLNHGTFDFKNLNPFLILHNLFSADVYKNGLPRTGYDLNNHYCSYLGINVDFYPIKNMRVYFVYAMTENQTKSELKTGTYAYLLPNGRGTQIGIDYNIPTKNNNLITTNVEALYSLPYLYLKQSPDWTLIKSRFDKHNGKSIYSWIGSPYGPDTAALNIKVGYEYQDKLKINLGYRLVMNGEMNAQTLEKKYSKNGNNYSAYYPSTLQELGVLSTDDAIKLARNEKLSGIIEKRHQITLECSYDFTKKLGVNAKIQENIVYNSQNIQDNFQNGLDCSFSVKYNFF